MPKYMLSHGAMGQIFGWVGVRFWRDVEVRPPTQSENTGAPCVFFVMVTKQGVVRCRGAPTMKQKEDPSQADRGKTESHRDFFCCM